MPTQKTITHVRNVTAVHLHAQLQTQVCGYKLAPALQRQIFAASSVAVAASDIFRGIDKRRLRGFSEMHYGRDGRLKGGPDVGVLLVLWAWPELHQTVA